MKRAESPLESARQYRPFPSSSAPLVRRASLARTRARELIETLDTRVCILSQAGIPKGREEWPLAASVIPPREGGRN